MNTKIAEIVEKLRLRDERYEAAKKNRKVNFEDLQQKPQQQQQQQKEIKKGQGQEDEEELSIFKAEKLKKRAEEFPKVHFARIGFDESIINGIKRHYLDDVLIKFGRICFKCPLIVLTSFSKKFHECDDNMCLHLSDYPIKATCFSYIYKWMMTEVLDGKSGLDAIPQKGVLEMLNASKILKIPHLEDQCWFYLQKTPRCNEKLAFDLYKTSEFNSKEIRHMMLSRITKYFLSLVASEDFLKLDANEISILLSLNTIGVNSEIEVFYAAILWLNAQWNERKGEILKKIIKNVRFNLMPSWFLVSLVERTGYEQVDRIINDFFVGNLLAEGIIFAANQLTNISEKPLDKTHLQYKIPITAQRRWIYDKSCVYHFRPNYECMEFVTYLMFTDYLNCLREFGDDYWRTLCFAEADHCLRIWKSRPSLKHK